MTLTLEQMNLVNKLIIRFLKDHKLYQYRKKDIRVISYDYFSTCYFLDTTLAHFVRKYMKCTVSLNTQLIFVTEYVTKLTEKTTEELFLQFLEENNITFKHLLKVFKNNNDVISENEYQYRLYIIKEYKPHIMAALEYCHYNMKITDGMDFPTFKKKWRTFYSQNIKFV